VALCNKTNFCQDYEILCEEGKVIDTIPIPNATIQNSKNWIDPRPIEEIINPCLN
jgi:hypothetical protein